MADFGGVFAVLTFFPFCANERWLPKAKKRNTIKNLKGIYTKRAANITKRIYMPPLLKQGLHGRSFSLCGKLRFYFY
jgi:hypothetical protein